jgi:hypothetical protein
MEMWLSICDNISTARRLLLKPGKTSTSRRKNVSPETSKKKSSRVVVKKPLAKLAVPENKAAERPAARGGAATAVGPA